MVRLTNMVTDRAVINHRKENLSRADETIQCGVSLVDDRFASFAQPEHIDTRKICAASCPDRLLLASVPICELLDVIQIGTQRLMACERISILPSVSTARRSIITFVRRRASTANGVPSEIVDGKHKQLGGQAAAIDWRRERMNSTFVDPCISII